MVDGLEGESQDVNLDAVKSRGMEIGLATRT